jgi:hypothetical protein
MKLALLLLIVFATSLPALPPPSLAGTVAVAVAIADHPKLITHGLRSAGHAIAKPFHRRKKP